MYLPPKTIFKLFGKTMIEFIPFLLPLLPDN